MCSRRGISTPTPRHFRCATHFEATLTRSRRMESNRSGGDDVDQRKQTNDSAERRGSRDTAGYDGTLMPRRRGQRETVQNKMCGLPRTRWERRDIRGQGEQGPRSRIRGGAKADRRGSNRDYYEWQKQDAGLWQKLETRADQGSGRLYPQPREENLDACADESLSLRISKSHGASHPSSVADRGYRDSDRVAALSPGPDGN